MSKISIGSKNGSIVILNKLSTIEGINQRELDTIARGMLDGLIPLSFFKKKKINCLRCTVAGKESLRNFLQGITNKKTFLTIVLEIARILIKCEKSKMNTENLVLSFDYIFIEPRTKELSFLYWPVVNCETSGNIADFFRDIPFQLVFNSYEDNGYVSEYIKYFKTGEPFSINYFERFLMQLAGVSGELEKKRVPTGETEKNNSLQVKEHTTGGLSNSVAYYPPTGTTSEPVPSSKAVDKLPEKRIPTQSFSETTVLGEERTNGGTTVLGEENSEKPTFPYLVREKTGENICVDKPSFRIGKEKRYCDYFVSDNNAVSRSHADIISRDNHYYIYDNNSTNKTYVDGRAIPIQKEIELFSGTKLKLANEEFTFFIRSSL